MDYFINTIKSSTLFLLNWLLKYDRIVVLFMKGRIKVKNNYPIKYAVMPIIEQVSWVPGLHELERNYDKVGYIVSKCYVLNETKTYNQNGTFKISYEVVFPYRFDNLKERIDPKLNSSNKTDKIFDTYEDARSEVKRKNEEIIRNASKNISWDYNSFKKFEKIQIEKFNNLKKLEAKIMEKTEDLIIGVATKKQNIIIVKDDKFILKNESLYDFMKFESSYAFSAYHISQDVYDELCYKIKNNMIIDEGNIRRYKLLVNDLDNQVIQIIMDIHNHDSGVFYIKNEYMCYDENMMSLKDTQSDIRVYTIEDYTDVIMSFIGKLDYNFDMEKNPVIRKVISQKMIK